MAAHEMAAVREDDGTAALADGDNVSAPTPEGDVTDARTEGVQAPPPPAPQTPAPSLGPHFILYKSDEEFSDALDNLTFWVHGLLLPVYGRELSSTAPWCPRWYEHLEAVAQLYGLWMAWQELTGESAPLTGPAMWHRDFLTPVMGALRDPTSIFAGCKPGQHRPKSAPPIEEPDALAPTT
ncbi:DUF4913 domain-containing protein [Streptomyces sp. NPDC002755]|uniref:DUF4913 domain-containing protein n=1 Tax=Streptomyces sp. NPDC002884 TaxID=3154544 RepID=UPI00332224E5